MRDLKAHWKMNDSAGQRTVIDVTGINNGTANFDLVSTIGKINKAITFDGTGTSSPTGDLINCGNDGSLNITTRFSISAWIKPKLIQLAECFTKGTDANTHEFEFYTSNNKMAVRLNNRGLQKTGTKLLTTGAWNYVVLVFDSSLTSGNLKTYINNELDLSEDYATDITTTTQNFIIGAWASSAWGFRGDIDDVRYYNIALTDEERGLLYNDGDGTEQRTPSEGKALQSPNAGEYTKTKIGKMTAPTKTLINVGVVE